MKYSVVIPIFNEEESLGELCSSLSKVMNSLKGKYEIIFVNDGSRDNSFSKLLSLKKRYKNIKIIDFRKNFGQSAAMKAGFDNAKGDIIIAMDSDLQNDPKDIPKLLKKLHEGYDVATGWRKERHDPLSKNIPSKISNWMHRKVTGLDMHDSGCSLKAYVRDALENVELYGEMHRYIPAMLAEKGYKVGEVVVTHHPRKHGKSKYGAKRLVKGGLDLIDILFWTKYASRPLHVFGSFGVVIGGTGLVMGIVLGILKILGMMSLSTSVLPLLSVLLFIVGLQFVIFGILADILIKIYYSNDKNSTYSIRKIIK